MAWKHDQRCPGLGETDKKNPMEATCPSCGAKVAILADEAKVRCPACGTMVFNIETPNNTERLAGKSLQPGRVNRDQLNALMETVRGTVATGAAVVDLKDISAEDHLAGLCADPRCSNYGRSASCPPHVEGPAFFRGLLKRMEAAIAVKIDVPSEILLTPGLSEDRREITRLLLDIAVGIEQAARAMGAEQSRAFAGGSCKRLFCDEYSFCNVVDQGGECRHPESARPSMSGFGVNVKQMVESVGWTMWSGDPNGNDRDSTGILVGLVLIG